MERLSFLTRSLWAKSSPVKSLWHHMLDTGLCAAQLIEEQRFAGVLRRIAELFSLSTQETKALIAYLCALHDYGKASPAFQKKDAALAAPFAQEGMLSMLDKAQGFRHERYGADCYEALGEELGHPAVGSACFPPARSGCTIRASTATQARPSGKKSAGRRWATNCIGRSSKYFSLRWNK